MESTEIWTDLLAKFWDCPDSVARILRDAPGYFLNIHPSEKAVLLEEILYQEKGLFGLFNKFRAQPGRALEPYVGALTEAFKFLQLLIDFSEEQYEPYIHETKNICCHYIQISLSVDLQMTASKTLKILLKKFKQLAEQLNHMIDNYKDSKYLITVGAIAKYCPEIIANRLLFSDHHFSDFLFDQLLDFLKDECNRPVKQIKKESLQIFLECFSDVMEHFFPHQGEDSIRYFQSIHKLLFRICIFVEFEEEIVKEIISVLVLHIKWFLPCIFKYYHKWHTLLLNKLKDNTDYFWILILQTFYENASLYLSKEDEQDMFNYFKEYFTIKLDDANSSSSCEIGLCIYGLGLLSTIHENYSSTDSQEVFQFIANKTLLNCSKNNDVNLDLMPSYLKALSITLKNSTKVTSQDLMYVTTLTTVIFKNFPKMKQVIQSDSKKAIETTFANITTLDKRMQSQYFCTVFDEVIALTCSHALNIDIELQQEIQHESEWTRSYKTYMPLWFCCFKIPDVEKVDQFREIFNIFASALMKAIDGWDLKDSINKQCDRDDYRCFLNFVDMSTEIFEGINAHLIEESLETLLLYFVKRSNFYPKISGFYKLIRAIFKVLDVTYHYEDRLSKNALELIYKYFLEVLQLINGFSGELQLSCICLIFNAPIYFIKDMINETLTVLALALEIGKNNIQLASMTLDVLEVWSSYFNHECLKDFNENIFVHLHPYLVNTDNMRPRNKDLESLQKKVLQYLGAAKFSKIKDLVFKDLKQVNAKWDKNFFSCQFLCSGESIELHLKQLIAPTIELTKSDSRRLKFSACEFLHTLVTIMLGNKQTHHCLDNNLLFIILRLGCDADDAIRNLFHPFVIQLTHYLSTKNLLDSKLSQQFVELLFKGIMCKSKLHTYCAICLKEFVTYLPGQQYVMTNLIYVIQKIQNLALRPAYADQIAAATAFNCLYATLNANMIIVNVYWLQFLHAFVKCLEHCSHPQITNAVDHVEKTIKEKANMLNGKSKGKRLVPTEFSSETLEGVLLWLLNKCGSVNNKCRCRFMTLFENLCLLVPEYKSVNKFFKSISVDLVNGIALKDLDDCESITLLNAKAFLRCLDFYMWIFSKRFLSPESVLIVDKEEDGKDVFFHFYSKFISMTVSQDVKDIVADVTHSLREADELIDQINKIILRIFTFTQTVLISLQNNESTATLLKNLWSNDLCTFVALYTLYPTQIGLTPKYLQLSGSKELESWLKAVAKKLPQVHQDQMKEMFLAEGNKYCKNIMDFDEFTNHRIDVVGYSYYVQGITILQACQFCDFREKMELTLDVVRKQVDFSFEMLTTNSSNGSIHSDLDVPTKNYIAYLLHFFLLEYEPSLVKFLVQKIMPYLTSTSSSSPASAKSNRIFEALQVPILEFLLKKPTETLSQVEELLPNELSWSDFFQFIEDLLRFAQKNPSTNPKDLANELSGKCKSFWSSIGNDEQLKDQFFDVYRIVLELIGDEKKAMSAKGELSSLYHCVMEELEAASLERKLDLLDNFFVYMIDTSGRPNAELKLMLRNLWNEDSSSWTMKLKSSELERARAVKLLRCLKRLLSATGLALVLEIIVKYIMDTGEFLEHERLDESLWEYFGLLTRESTLVSLEAIFAVFLTTDFSCDERLIVLERVLLPLLAFADVDMLNSFFQHTVNKEIGKTVSEPLADASEREQRIATRIGYFRVAELTLSRTRISCTLADGNPRDLFLVPTSVDEQELVRQFNCSMLNYLIVMVNATTSDVKPFSNTISTLLKNDPKFWELIVDCERRYDLSAPPQSRSRRVHNMRPVILDRQAANKRILDSLLNSYFRPANPTVPEDSRQGLVLEDDELNDHECMSTLTALWMHYLNDVDVGPVVEGEADENVDMWVVCVRAALLANKDNVTLFVLRLLGNGKQVLLPFMGLIFAELAKALNSYLNKNPMNYLVRDALVLIIESKLDPCINDQDGELRQTLVEFLVDRAADDDPEIYEYNISLIEALFEAWPGKLKILRNLEKTIAENKDLAMRLILIMFKHNVECEMLFKTVYVHEVVRDCMFGWRDPMIERTFKTVGLIMKYADDDSRYKLVKEDLVDLLLDIERIEPYPPYKTGRNCCVRQLYMIFKSYPAVVEYGEVKRFMNPKTVSSDQRKLECLEMLSASLKNYNAQAVLNTFEFMDLMSVLNERLLICLDVAFTAVNAVIRVLSADEIRPYLLALKPYTKHGTILQHRKQVYQIFMDAYMEHTNTERSRSEDTDAVLELSREVLINGVIDPSDDVQRDIIAFWKKHAGLPSDLYGRLFHLLQMYNSNVASSYTQFLCGMLLELARVNENRVPLFPGLVEQQYLRDYEIATPSLRLRSSKNRIPLLAPALARRLELAVELQGSDCRDMSKSEQVSQAAGNLERALVDKLTRSNDFCVRKNLDQSKDTLSRRSFIKKSNGAYSSISIKYHKDLLKEISEQNDSVKVNRKYRIGDVPDVEITQMDLIVTLQDLALHNRRFAEEMTVLLVWSVLQCFNNTEMHSEMIEKIGETCKQALETVNDFSSVAMYMLHYTGFMDFDADSLMKAAKSMNLQTLGIQILERNLISCDQSIYDVQEKSIYMSYEHPMQLVSMYRSIGEKDVVNSILRNWVNSLPSNELVQGYLAEEAGDWERAKTIYQKVAEDNTAEDHFTEGMFRCLSELSDWNQLNDQLDKSLGSCKVWDHPKQEEVLPWMFTGRLQSMLVDLLRGREPELEFFEEAIAEIPKGRRDLLKKFGEELSFFYISGNGYSVSASRRCLLSCLDYVREQWTSSNPLPEEPRLRLLDKLGRLTDAKVHLATLESASNSDATKLVDYWNDKIPEPGTGLFSWNLRVASRLGFSCVFFKVLDAVSMSPNLVDCAESVLQAGGVRQYLKISELALESGNKKMVKKYIKEIEKVFNCSNFDVDLFPELSRELEYVLARYKFLRAKDESDAKRKLDHFVDSWKLADDVAKNDEIDLSIRIQAKRHIAQVVQTLHDEIHRDPRYAVLVAKDDFVASSLQGIDSTKIEDKLKDCHFELLESVCTEGSDKEIGENLLVLADYYYQLLQGTYDRSSKVHKEYMNAVLTAMAYGSDKATRYFVDLLNYKIYTCHSDLAEFFVEKCKNIPTSVFLLCHKEILSHLDTSQHQLRETLILPIVERLVNDFPSDILFKFNEIWQVFHQPDNRKRAESKKNLQLFRTEKIVSMFKTVVNSHVEFFFKAMEYLMQPEQYLKFQLSQILKSNQTSSTLVKALKAFVEKICPHVDSQLRGATFQKILDINSERLSKSIKTLDLKELPMNVKNLCTKLDKEMTNRLKTDKTVAMMLKSYSTYLANFPFEKFKIPVPGIQNKSVLPSDRVMIARIDSYVEIISKSKHCSLKIHVIGTNGKFYEFLVKYGTDIRRDERMQQLFKSMNETLRADSKCVKRRLLVQTYSVIPIDKNMSLVQWMKEAKSLRDFIEYNKTKMALDNLAKDYQKWIEQADPENSNVKSKCHKQALLRYSPDQVRAKLKELTEKLLWDLLRRTFVRIASSVECFFKLRQNFTRCYAVTCAVDWIAGVGDRRLENILIDISSGRCFGINYHVVFGTGLDQPVPELVPFRLTAQILGLFRPFTARDLFGATMSHVLGALRKEQNLILVYVNMSLYDNLKWDQLVEERWLEDSNQYKGKWLPEFKYKIVKRKISGDKPSSVMIDELSHVNNYENEEYFPLYKCIISGTEIDHEGFRSDIADHNLTPEQQMLCLIDQATDTNLLGRMSTEWCPFV